MTITALAPGSRCR